MPSRTACLLLLIAICNAPLRAAFDPAESFANPLPESGRWSAKDGSLTGLFIEVQNGILAGLYVGADASGEHIWLSFDGRLEPRASTDFIGGWILETELLRFFGVGCILDCTGSAGGPSGFDVVGSIRLEFLGRQEAAVSIDGGEPLRIAPIYFGVETWPVLVNDPPRWLPDLQGQWLVASNAESDPAGPVFATTAVTLGPRRILISDPVDPSNVPPDFPFYLIRHSLVGDLDGRFPEGAVLGCTLFWDVQLPPRCTLQTEDSIELPFSIDSRSLSDARFVAIESPGDGTDRIQHSFLRLFHD